MKLFAAVVFLISSGAGLVFGQGTGRRTGTLTIRGQGALWWTVMARYRRQFRKRSDCGLRLARGKLRVRKCSRRSYTVRAYFNIDTRNSYGGAGRRT